MNNHYKQKPVIFLAFANDRVSHVKYLRNLPHEQRGIRNTLDKAKQSGLCEVVERSNVTVADILDVFQDKTYKDRIAIFHYGGHADGYKLLLETAAGARSFAHKEGLATFFARQNSLRLIFLNACSTQQHALELIQAGIPAVIGTSQDINDQVATQLSIRFYNGIANGFVLERAWRAAEDEIKIRKGSSNFNAMYHYSQQEKHQDRFPWDIYFKEGAEKVKRWSLPDAAHDPLFGLPPLPRTEELPEKPFLSLERYQRKHAGIFFGRSYYIRQLYERIADEKSSPIILLYGQSGVGKSSLLEAGLLPRLENSHTVLYTRRLQEKGLLGTLEQALNEQLFLTAKSQELRANLKSPPERVSAPQTSPRQVLDIGKKWKLIEFNTHKPLVIILDQVEEMFTHFNKGFPNEFEAFIRALKNVFKKPDLYPGGKLILAYRKEYHSDIDDHIVNNELDRTRLFLKPLNRQDIIEVVTGLTRSKRLRDKYNIEVEDQLPVIIADDLLEDRDSPVAPTLQILLTKMWDNSKEDEFTLVRHFTIKQYQDLRKQGLLMEDFFKQQMEKLKTWNTEVVESGLALDLLKFHTTELSTGRSRGIDDIRRIYPLSRIVIDDLVKQLKHLYLLADTRRGKHETSLSHDTLAKIVRKEYNKSDKPGQRAARILAAKIENVDEKKQDTYLDKADLHIVEQGQAGIKRLKPKEKKLVQRSRKRERTKKMLRSAVIFIIVFLVTVAAWRWVVALDREKQATAGYLTLQARLLLNHDPATAIRMAEEAYELKKNKDVMQVLSQAAAQTLERPFYNANMQHDHYVNDTLFSPSGSRILTISSDKTAKLWDLGGKLLATLPHPSVVHSAQFAPDGRLILTASRDNAAKLWNFQGKFIRDYTHDDKVTSAVFSPDGTRILTASNDNTARLWDLPGNLLKRYLHPYDVDIARFSPDGSRILTLSNRTARLWDLHGTVCKRMNGVIFARFSPKGKYIIAVSFNNTVKLWNQQDDTQKIFNHHTRVVKIAVFTPDGSSILVAYLGGRVELWDLNGQVLAVFAGHEDSVNDAVFSPDSTRILTASWDSSAKLWDLSGTLIANLEYHKGSVRSAVFSPDGTQILTASSDNTAKRWDLEDQPVMDLSKHSHPVRFASFSPDGTHILVVFFDNTVKLWDARGNPAANMNGHTKAVNSAKFSPDGSLILTASADKTAKLWSSGGQLLEELNSHTDNVNSAVFSPDGRLILTASFDNTAKLWDLQGNMLQSVQHRKGVISAVFSPDGTKILTASYDKTAKLWDLQGNLLRDFNSHSFQVDTALFSPDGTKVLTVSTTARLWKINGDFLKKFYLKNLNKKLKIEKSEGVDFAVFSPGGKRVLTVSKDNTARLWDLHGKLLTRLEHQAKIHSAEFSPDGTRIVTASADKTVKLWDLRGNLLSDFDKHKGDVYSAVFSPDGKKILSASADKTVILRYTPEAIIQWLKTSPIPKFKPKKNIIQE